MYGFKTYMCVFLLTAFLYLICAPHTVQTLDTGELVTNSYLLRISHPPGYPLFHWLYHFFLNTFPLGSVFFKASLLTIILSISTLTVLFFQAAKSNIITATSLTLALATSSIFWKLSLLPDVFMLHALITTLISILYLFSEQFSFRKTVLFFLLFGLGVANHHTIIFLFPIVLDLCWKKVAIKKLVPAALLAIVLATLIYYSFLLFDSTALSSWDYVDSPGKIWEHFLRKAYGTLSLSVHKSESWLLPSIIKSIYQLSSPIILSLIFTLILFSSKGLKKTKAIRKWAIYGSCFLIYVLGFFSMVNLSPEQRYTEEVLERFYLMPLMLLAIWAIYSFVKTHTFFTKKTIRLISVLFSLIIISNLVLYYPKNNFRKNTVVEDWAKNRLNAVQDDKTIMLVTSDSGYFALTYVQNVLKFKPNIQMLSPLLLLNDWYLKKAEDLIPNFKYQKGGYCWERNIIKPNLDSYQFNIPSNKTIDYNAYKVTIHALGKTISKGQGIEFDNRSIAKMKYQHFLIPPQEYHPNSYWIFNSRYTHFFLERAATRYQAEHKTQDAIDDYKIALQIAPYLPGISNTICTLKKELNSTYVCDLDDLGNNAYFKFLRRTTLSCPKPEETTKIK